jgi:hypothetical protein
MILKQEIEILTRFSATIYDNSTAYWLIRALFRSFYPGTTGNTTWKN